MSPKPHIDIPIPAYVLFVLVAAIAVLSALALVTQILLTALELAALIVVVWVVASLARFILVRGWRRLHGNRGE